jgi:hypothetical protein
MGKDLGLIDTSFLKYTPGETQLAVAAAVNPGLPWKDVLSTAQMIPGLDFGTRMMVESVLSQLQLAEGTVSLAAAPAAGAPALATFSFATWDVIAMARFPEAVTGETVDRITGMARMAGLAVSLDQGIYTADLSAVDRRLGSLYYGALDGNLALSTRPFDSMTDNQLASVFEGKSAAAVLDIPYRSETMKALELPYGINVTAQIDGGRLQIRARFNGSNSSFMSTLAKML